MEATEDAKDSPFYFNNPPISVLNLFRRTEEEDVEVTEDAKDLLTKIGVETSLR